MSYCVTSNLHVSDPI